MGMGPHIEARSGRQYGWTYLVEKHERAHRAALCRRKNAANLEATAEIGVRDTMIVSIAAFITHSFVPV